MVDDSRTTEAMVDDRLCDDDSTRMINSTSTISDRVLVGNKRGGLTCILRDGLSSQSPIETTQNVPVHFGGEM